MVLRLDPRLPLLWRSETTLQIGLDEPAAILADVDDADELMLDALRTGTSSGTVRMIGSRAGASDARIDALLDRVRPALHRERPAGAPAVVVVEGEGSASAAVRTLLRHAGLVVAESSTRRLPALAVLVAGFAHSPARSAHWLSADVPHLAVCFGDTAARVGPMVEPGSSGCLHCADRYRIDADPDWPRLVIQLLGRTGSSETPLLSGYVAAIVAEAVLARLRTGRSDLVGRSRSYRDASGALSEIEHPPHPECGCRALPGTATAPGG